MDLFKMAWVNTLDYIVTFSVVLNYFYRSRERKKERDRKESAVEA